MIQNTFHVSELQDKNFIFVSKTSIFLTCSYILTIKSFTLSSIFIFGIYMKKMLFVLDLEIFDNLIFNFEIYFL